MEARLVYNKSIIFYFYYWSANEAFLNIIIDENFIRFGNATSTSDALFSLNLPNVDYVIIADPFESSNIALAKDNKYYSLSSIQIKSGSVSGNKGLSNASLSKLGYYSFENNILAYYNTNNFSDLQAQIGDTSPLSTCI